MESFTPLHPAARELPPREGGLAAYPPVERWNDWEEYDPVSYTHLTLPTIYSV